MPRRVELTDLNSDNNGLHFHDDLRYSGEAVETLENNALLSLTTYVNGVEEGPHRLWHANGNLEFSCELRDGNPIGLTQAWREDGSLEEEQQFDEAGKLVWSRRWDESGALVDDRPSRSA